MTTNTAGYHLQAGIAAQAAGDLAAAKREFLLAGKLLLTEAGTLPSPQTRQRRFEQARQLQARIDELTRLMERPQGVVPGGPTPEAAENDATPQWLVVERPKVRLDDVAGLDEVKRQVYLKLILPYTHPAEAELYGVQPGGGILLYGPPGTGKTFVAQAVAGELDAAFFEAKASSLMSQWFGKAEQNVAALFAAARREPREVLFLDEIEALVPKRSGTNSSVMPRVISEFLSQSQGFATPDGHALLLLGATNEPWNIDEAALRSGRLSELIYVGLPDVVARLRILETNLRHRPVDPALDLSRLAAALEGYSGADIAYICRSVSERAFEDAVAADADRLITQADFDLILAERRPTVTSRQIRRFERFHLEGQ